MRTIYKITTIIIILMTVFLISCDKENKDEVITDADEYKIELNVRSYYSFPEQEEWQKTQKLYNELEKRIINILNNNNASYQIHKNSNNYDFITATINIQEKIEAQSIDIIWEGIRSETNNNFNVIITTIDDSKYFGYQIELYKNEIGQKEINCNWSAL